MLLEQFLGKRSGYLSDMSTQEADKFINMNVKEIVLQDLISFTKDGEWGKDKDTGSSIEMYVIRGTDFQDVKAGYFGNLPIRWIPKHIAEKKTLEAGDVLIELAGGTVDNPTGRS